MCPSLIQIGLKTAEKNSAQTNRQTDRQTNRHYENNGHLAVNQHRDETQLRQHRPWFCCSKLQRSWWTSATAPAHLTRSTSHSSDKLKLKTSASAGLQDANHTMWLKQRRHPQFRLPHCDLCIDASLRIGDPAANSPRVSAFFIPDDVDLWRLTSKMGKDLSG